jgi:hypothetical protein
MVADVALRGFDKVPDNGRDIAGTCLAPERDPLRGRSTQGMDRARKTRSHPCCEVAAGAERTARRR